MAKSIDLHTLIEGFRLYCLAGGKQPTTIRWYMGKLTIFQDYLKDHDIPTEVSQITITHLRQFLVYLQTEVKADQHNPYKPTRDEGLSPQTIQGYARTLKAFFSWATAEGYLVQNPAKHLKIPKAPKTILETFSDEQIRRLLNVIDKRSAVGFRDYCIILVFLDTGIRLSELVTLRLPDIHLDQAYFKVLGKGAKERIIPIGARVQKALWKYIHRYRPEPLHPNIQNVFLTRDGRALSPRTVYQRISDYGKKAGLTGVRCSPHSFRHTFAKNFLLNGGDALTLQKILGHTSLEVVRIYVNLASKDVQVQHSKASPVDRLKL